MTRPSITFAAVACTLALAACSKQAPSGDESASPTTAPAESTVPPESPPAAATATAPEDSTMPPASSTAAPAATTASGGRY